MAPLIVFMWIPSLLFLHDPFKLLDKSDIHNYDYRVEATKTVKKNITEETK